MTKKKFILENIFFFILLCGIGIQISIGIFLSKINVSFFDYISKNWSSPLYFNLKFTNESCSENQTNILKTLSWKGTVGAGKDYFGNVFRMSYNQTPFGYNSIPSSGTFSINKFSNSNVCAELIATNYYSISKASSQAECQGKLSESYIDSMNNYACNLEIKDNFQEKRFYSFFTLNEKQPCLDPEYLNEVEYLDYLDYFYENNKCPDNKVDNNYEKIGGETLLEFMTKNEILTKLEKLFENTSYKITNITDKHQINLYGRNYIGLKTSEQCKIDEQFVIYLYVIGYNVSKANSWNIGSILLYIAFFLLFLVKYSVVVSKYYNFKEKMPSYAKPILMIISILNFIVSCVLFTTMNKMGMTLMQRVFSKNNHCMEPDVLDITDASVNYIVLSYYFSLSSMIVQFIIGVKYGIRTAIKYAN